MRLASIPLTGVLLVRTAAVAQRDRGDATSTIAGCTGAVIPGASLTAREIGTDVTLMSSSNKGGVYAVAPLKVAT